MKEYKNITKQVGGIYFIKILDFVVTFLSFIILTRILSQNDFGIYTILNVTATLFSTLLCLGLNEFIVRDLTAKDNKTKIKRFHSIVGFIEITLIINFIITLSLGYFIIKSLGYESLLLPGLLVVVASGITVFGSLFSSFFYANKESFKTVSIEFLFRSFWNIPVIIIALLVGISINQIFSIRLLIVIIAFIVIVIYLKKSEIFSLRKIDWMYVKKALVFSLPLLVMVSAQWIISSSNRYILGIYHSAIAVAQFSYVYSLLNTILILSTAAISIGAYPYIVENFNKNRKEKSNILLNSVLKYIMLIIIPALVGFAILSKEIITMISGYKYLESISIIPTLILFPLTEGINVSCTFALLLNNETKKIAKIYVAGMIVNLLLNFLLIPKYSYYGAGIATTLSYIFLSVVFLMYTKDYVKFDMTYLKIPTIILSALLMAASIAFIHPTNFISKISTIVLGGLVYLVGLYLFGVFTKQEKEIIINVIKMKR